MAIKIHNYRDQGDNLMTIHILESLKRRPKIILIFILHQKIKSLKN